MATKKQVLDAKQVKSIVHGLLADLKGTADGIACELARKGVKKALCEDAMSQFDAGQYPFLSR